MKKLLKYIVGYYYNIYLTFKDNYKLRRSVKNLRKKIIEAKKRFLNDSRQYHVFEDPHKSGRYFTATHKQFEILVQKNVDFVDLMQLSLYCTPQRLCEETIKEVNSTDVEVVINKIMSKIKL